jgi:pullulanase/glycogen debranching enzyme
VLGYPASNQDTPSDADSAASVPRSLVVAGEPVPRLDRANWSHTYADTVIYEVHVKGFTMRHPGIPAELRGTFAGGTEMTAASWSDPNALAIALYLDGSDDPDRAGDGTWLLDDDFLVLVNAWWEPLEFVLPATRPEAGWRVEIDTYDPAPPAGSAAARYAGDHVTAGPRSVVVLLSPR